VSDPQEILKAVREKRYFEALDLPGDATVEQVREQEVALAHRHRSATEVVAAIHHSADVATVIRRHADGATDAPLPDGVEICWFCKRRMADAEAVWNEDMYKVLKKTDFGISKRFQYKTVKAPVPRCKNCKALHEAAQGKSSNVGCVVGIASALVGIILGVANHSFFGGLVAGFFFGLFGFAIASGIAEAVFKPKETKPPSHSSEYDSIKALRADGWSFGKEPSKSD
jgi:hypothetical protein